MKTYIVFVFGIDHAGKTSLVNIVKGGNVDRITSPTISFNVQNFVYENIQFQIWDAPGQKKFRKIWQLGYDRAKILMFVLDYSNDSRFVEAKAEFFKVINNPINRGIPIIFCVHKIDLEQNYIDFDSIKSHFLPLDNVSRKIFWIGTSIFDLNSIRHVQNTLLDIVLGRAKSSESYLKVISVLSQEIKNKLMEIHNYSDMLKGNNLDAESDEYVNQINNILDDSNTLIDNLISSKEKITPGFDTKTVLLDSIRFVSRGNKCKFQANFQTDVPFLHVDMHSFIQIVNNVLINATDAVLDKSDEGIISVSETLVNIPPHNEKQFLKNSETPIEMRQGDYIQISIEDNGVGVSPEIHDKLLNSDFLSKSGLECGGISTAISLLNDFGGFMNFQSTPSQGSTFHIYMPLLKQEIDSD